MSFANTFGKSLGTAGAYAKHAVITSGIGSVNFVANTRDAAVAQYHSKDAELARKRDELRAQRATALPLPATTKAAKAPAVRRQRKVAV